MKNHGQSGSHSWGKMEEQRQSGGALGSPPPSFDCWADQSPEKESELPGRYKVLCPKSTCESDAILLDSCVAGTVCTTHAGHSYRLSTPDKQEASSVRCIGGMLGLAKLGRFREPRQPVSGGGIAPVGLSGSRAPPLPKILSNLVVHQGWRQKNTSSPCYDKASGSKDSMIILALATDIHSHMQMDISKILHQESTPAKQTMAFPRASLGAKVKNVWWVSHGELSMWNPHANQQNRPGHYCRKQFFLYVKRTKKIL